jgi:rare lipoprotein A
MIQLILAILAVFQFFTTPPKPQIPQKEYKSHIEGIASYYQEGTRTACGDFFEPDDITVALTANKFNRGLCGREIRITSSEGITVFATINDRMPPNSRVLDLSRGTRNALGGHDLTKVVADY